MDQNIFDKNENVVVNGTVLRTRKSLHASATITNKPPPQRSELEEKFYHFFELVDSFEAKVFRFLSIGFIIVILILNIIDSMPEMQKAGEFQESPLENIIFPIETIGTVIWILELAGKWFCSPSTLKFFTTPMILIDIVTIIPYFLQFGKINGIQILTILRLLRIIKLLKFSKAMQVVGTAMRKSGDAIFLLVMLLIMMTLLTSSAMHIAERGKWIDGQWTRKDGNRSPFSSVPEGFYWAMTTLSTVGYGDVSPQSAAGKFIAALTMIGSILCIALPTSIIGTRFMTEWNEFEKNEAAARGEVEVNPIDRVNSMLDAMALNLKHIEERMDRQQQRNDISTSPPKRSTAELVDE